MAKKKAKKTVKKEKQIKAKIVKKEKKKKEVVKDSSDQAIDIDTFYKVVNKVQLSREKATFSIAESESSVVENILKDASIDFKKKLKNRIATYSVFPPPEREKAKESETFEDLTDEILEEGQIFF